MGGLSLSCDTSPAAVIMLALSVLALLCTSLLPLSAAELQIEWTITGEPFEVCILPGETLTFEWDNGHNVERVSQEGYEDCSGFKSDEPVEGPFEFSTSTEGTYYFVCGVGKHCEFGNQKAVVTVDKSC